MGGIVAEEVIKFTGLFKPVSQWVYFNFFSLIDFSTINDKLENSSSNKKEGEENLEVNTIFNLFNEIFYQEYNDINILIIGLNDISYEILKLFFTLGLLESKDNKINIISDNDYEINEKMNDLKNYGKNNNISIIKEKINIEENNYLEKDWWNKSSIIIDALSSNMYLKEKISIIKNSKKNNKTLISLNGNKSSASYEIFLPENKNNNLNYIIEETPEGPEEKNEIKIEEEDNNNENYEEYRNISTLDEALDWSMNYFKNYFIVYIKYLIEIINRSNSETEMLNYIDKILSEEKKKDKDKDSDITILLIKMFKKLVSLKLGMVYETIVFYSIEIFEQLFSNFVDKILQKYPSDLIIKNTNKKFWSGARKEPKKIVFDLNNEEHFELIYCMTYLLCEILKMPDIDNKMKNIKQAIEKYEPKKPDSVGVKKMKLKEYSYIEKISLVQILKNSGKENLEFKALEINYGKDNENFDDLKLMNKQLKFIILAANIKLSNFGINENNKNDFICKVLNINKVHPCASSSIAGIVVMQLYSLINKNKIKEKEEENENINKIEEIKKEDELKNKTWIKNCTFNLANNTYLFFDLDEK